MIDDLLTDPEFVARAPEAERHALAMYRNGFPLTEGEADDLASLVERADAGNAFTEAWSASLHELESRLDRPLTGAERENIVNLTAASANGTDVVQAYAELYSEQTNGEGHRDLSDPMVKRELIEETVEDRWEQQRAEADEPEPRLEGDDLSTLEGRQRAGEAAVNEINAAAEAAEQGDN